MRRITTARTSMLAATLCAMAMAQSAVGAAKPKPGEIVRHMVVQSVLLSDQDDLNALRRVGVANDAISISEGHLLAEPGNPQKFIRATDEEVREARARFKRSVGHGVAESFDGIMVLDVENPSIGQIATQVRNWDRSEDSIQEIAAAYERRVRIWSENRPELGPEYVGFPNAKFCFWGSPTPNGIRTNDYEKNLRALRILAGVDPMRKVTRRGRGRSDYVLKSALAGCAFMAPQAYPAFGFDDLAEVSFKDPDAPTCELNRKRKVVRTQRDLLDDRVRWGVTEALRLLDAPTAPPELADIDVLVMMTFRVSNGYPNTKNPLQCLQSFDPTLSQTLGAQVNEARRLRTGTAWQPGDFECGNHDSPDFAEPDLGAPINVRGRSIHYGFWVQDIDNLYCAPCNYAKTEGHWATDTVPQALMNVFCLGDFDDDGIVTSADAAYLNSNYGDDPWFDIDLDGNWTTDWADDFGALTRIMFGSASGFRNSGFGPVSCSSN